MWTLRKSVGPRTVRHMTELLDIHDIKRIFKLERTAAYQLTKTPGFPTPVRLSSGCLRWTLEGVQAFIELKSKPESQEVMAVAPRLEGVSRSRRVRRPAGK